MPGLARTVTVVVLMAVGLPALLCAPAPADARECTAAGAVSSANRARRVLGQLDRFEAMAWQERQHSIDILEGHDETAAELEELDSGLLDMVRIVAGSARDARRFGGLTACGPERRQPASLTRGWWGFYHEMQLDFGGFDVSGARTFYVTSYDKLSTATRSLRWTETIFGVSYDYSLGVRTTFAATYEGVPDNLAEAEFLPESLDRDGGWGILASVGSTAFGVRATVATQPGLDGISLAQLELDSVELPGGLRAGATAGYLHDESPLIVAGGLYDIPGGFAIEGGAYPVERRPGFLRARWSHSFTRLHDPQSRQDRESSPSILEAAPFAQASMSYLAPSSGDPEAGWSPGFVAGIDARMHMIFATLGLRIESGMNDARDLLAVPELDDRLFWGMQFYVQGWL